MFNVTTVSCEFGGRKLTLETGRLAKQADGSVLVTYGESMVLVTVCMSSQPKEGIDFLPLTVEFQEKFYSAGRIPGGFFKREGRPSTDATLMARAIDRPLRPLFPEGFYHEVQIVAQVLSLDNENDPDVMATIGASAALAISRVPFTNIVASCRVGRVNGELIANPSVAQLEQSDMEVLISGTKNAIMMVEGGAKVVSEDDMLKALLFGHNEAKKVLTIIDQLVAKVGREKITVTAKAVDLDLKGKIASLAAPVIEKALVTRQKEERYDLFDKAKEACQAAVITDDLDKDQASERKKLINHVIEDLKYNGMREAILSKGERIDGRTAKDIRPISVEVGLLPRAHGSALFTRGETQVLAVATLGTGEDQQMIDAVRGAYDKKFMLNYNFPPFSVGEVGRIGTPGRREVGHGALAERALENILPGEDKVPYTVRLVCEVLESNGSSSMGSVCSGSMAMMDAGVKIPAPVAGIAMGLIKDAKGRVAILSDILGDEDHLGDMDFKVAGTSEGITAIQMDIKIEGVDENIMRTALAQARDGRLHILSKMQSAITTAKEEVSEHAPRFITMKIKPEKIREVIGSGGKVIKDIIARTGVKMDVEDDGTIRIASTSAEGSNMAVEIIKGIVAEPEPGKIYKGKIVSIVEFGAFVEVLPGCEGLLHVSEIAHERVKNVKDYLKEGEEIEVKCLEVEKNGKIRLSRKALLEKPANAPASGGGSQGGGKPSGHDRHPKPVQADGATRPSHE